MKKNNFLPTLNSSFLVHINQTENEIIFKHPRHYSIGLVGTITAAFLTTSIYLYLYYPEDMNTLFPGLFLVATTIMSFLALINFLFVQEKLILSKKNDEATYTYLSLQEKIYWTKKFSEFEQVQCILDTDDDANKIWFFYLKTSEGKSIPLYKGLTHFEFNKKDKAVAFAKNIANFMNINLIVETKI